MLPTQFGSSGIERTTNPETYAGQSLYEYINGGAELYHLYNFINVTTATYKSREAEIVADIYKFDTPDNAFGLYTLMRPDNPETVTLGVEGFTTSSSLEFVKDKYLVRVTGYDNSQETQNGIAKIAAELSSSLSGKTTKPDVFSYFPKQNMIPASEKYLADSYMGYSFINHVYTINYGIDGDTLTLFTTDDPDGEKYLQWSEALGDEIKPLTDFSYEQGKAFLMPDEFYGHIAAGLKKGKLLGVINYHDQHKQFLENWLGSIH